MGLTANGSVESSCYSIVEIERKCVMDIISVLKKKPCFQSYTPATKDYIENAEKNLSLKFTSEYKNYITTLGFATYEGHELTGFCKAKRLNVIDVTLMEREYINNLPADWYVVEQLNMDGVVIWQSKTGEIYQTCPGSEPKKICDSLAEYIDM